MYLFASKIQDDFLAGVTRRSLWPDIRAAALFDFGLTAAVGLWLFFEGKITGNGAPPCSLYEQQNLMQRIRSLLKKLQVIVFHQPEPVLGLQGP